MTNHWKDIHHDFNYHGWDGEKEGVYSELSQTNYQKDWESNGFNYLQTKEWIDIGMLPKDAEFCAYLRDVKQLEPLSVLNFEDVKLLRKEYQNKEATRLKELESALTEAREENQQLVSNLHAMQVEIDQLNLTLLHQQKISSQVSKSKKEMIEDYNLLEQENEQLKSSLNSLNNLESEINCLKDQNQRLLQANSYLQVRVNNLTHLINQKQISSLPITNWLERNKQPLLIIGIFSLASYLLLKE